MVGVHILERERNAGGCYNVEFLFHFDLLSNCLRSDCAKTYINSLGSVITPVTAAAAATSGEARIVREPGP